MRTEKEIDRNMLSIEDPAYLKSVIKHLIELNNYPDIRISDFSDVFGENTRIRAELITVTGEIIADEVIVDDKCFQFTETRDHIEEKLLRNISYAFLKRSYEKRKKGEIRALAPNFLRSCQTILSEENQ